MPESRVFAVQQPTKWSHGRPVPSMDLAPAETFGDVRFLLHPAQNPFNEPDLPQIIRHALRAAAFDHHDYLLLVGNPILIGVTAAVAADLNDGRLRMLQWQREGGHYEPVEFQGLQLAHRPQTA